MSRCFPYPSPGYRAKRESNVASIESIELQKEREKAKARDERKREKKDKRRERELHAKQNASELDRGEKRKLHGEKTHEWKKDKVDLKGSDVKYGESEAEQLEGSDITEEHEQPVCSENPCCSTDSIQNSNKRRKQASPVHGIHAHGNIIRIRLPSKKQNDHDPTDREERFCSTSGRTETNVRHNSETVHGTRHEESCFTTSMETGACVQGRIIQGCSTSGVVRSFNQDNTRTSSSGSTAFGNGMILESLYKDQVENWVPPHLQREHADLDELEWLLQRKHPHEPKERCKANSEVLCTGSSTLWPRAQYLPEADMHALPFTVLF